MEKEPKKKTFIVEKSEAKSETISFDAWFSHKVNQRRKVQPHHYDTLLTFFKKQGLSEQETNQDFDSALKAFGY